MKIGDEDALAGLIQRARTRQCLSQAELGERAAVSTKTVQRMEAGEPVAGSSRRAILGALDIDLDMLGRDADSGEPMVAPQWVVVEDARTLLRLLVAAATVDIEVDRDGWRQAWRERPWHKQGFYIATRDPVDQILELADQAIESADLAPGRRAKQEDDLGKAIRDANLINWGLAYRHRGSGALSLYIGSPAVAARRARSPADDSSLRRSTSA